MFILGLTSKHSVDSLAIPEAVIPIIVISRKPGKDK